MTRLGQRLIRAAKEARDLALTPEQKASVHLFGDSEFTPFSKDHEFCDPFNMPHRVSFNQLIARYNVQSAAEIEACNVEPLA